MTESLDEMAARLRSEQEACEAQALCCEEAAARHRQAAQLLGAKLWGIEEARRTFEGPIGNGSETTRRRRDIRAMIAEIIKREEELGTAPRTAEEIEYRIHEIARHIGCRPSQVRHWLQELRA